MATAQSDCQPGIRWDTELLVHTHRAWPGFSMHVLERRASGPCAFDLLAPTHVLSLPLAGAEPLLDGRLERARLRFPMLPGHAMLRPAHHRYRGVSLGAGRFRYAMLVLAPELIARATDGALDAATAVAPAADLTHPIVLSALAALAAQAEHPGPGGRLHAESLATTILVELVRHRVIGDGAFRAAIGRTGAELGRFAVFVEDHLADDLSLFALAAAAGLSASHLTRELKRVTGLAPHQYVLRRRAERARRLLDRRDRSLGEVALAVGFSSQAHLTLAFRRVYGITPGAYRAG